MASGDYQQARSKVSEFPHIHGLLDDSFIAQQCRTGPTNYLLARLCDPALSENAVKHLPTLERRLSVLADVSGYERLKSVLRGASDWDQYQEMLAQLDFTVWFKSKGIVSEIAPLLPHRDGSADILLSTAMGAAYCEVACLQSIMKGWKAGNSDGYIHDRSNEERQIARVARNLLDKTKRQLPPGYAGILALDTSKSSVFSLTVRDIAQKLFQRRPQLALLVLHSLEGEGEPSWEFDPNEAFLNVNSKYAAAGSAIANRMGIQGQRVGP